MGERGSEIEMVVFADDWGRHPSSAQHLVRHLLPGLTGTALWVNTVGTRTPRWSDVGRIISVLRQWGSSKPQAAEVPNLRVIAPRMYPGFRTRWQRALNARLLTASVNRELATPPRAGPSPAPDAAQPRSRVAVTTLPITADLVGKIDVDRWVYYCVDDFSVWPGLDSRVMQEMERELVAKVDAVVAVSEVLAERVRTLGKEPVLLTHGVDLEVWTNPEPWPVATWRRLDRPLFTFWGLIDDRLDLTWCRRLAERIAGTVALAGPTQEGRHPAGTVTRVYLTGKLEHRELPALAERSAVLVMPYIDAPVTRAMQPLKLLEYLATYRPVVVRDLPATRAWADCCDVVSTADDFVRVCLERAQTGLPADQRAARERRLPGESWSEKARVFSSILWPDAGEHR